MLVQPGNNIGSISGFCCDSTGEGHSGGGGGVDLMDESKAADDMPSECMSNLWFYVDFCTALQFNHLPAINVITHVKVDPILIQCWILTLSVGDRNLTSIADPRTERVQYL